MGPSAYELSQPSELACARHACQPTFRRALPNAMSSDMLRHVKTIGRRLRYLMAERQKAEPKLTGADVNEAIGKNRDSGYFSRLVNDKRKDPDPDDVKKIADYFGVSFDWLFWGRGAMEPLATQTETGLSEMLRASTSGLGAVAREVAFDNIEAALLFAKRVPFAPEVVQGLRDDLAAAGTAVDSRDPIHWLKELLKRQKRYVLARMKDAEATDKETLLLTRLLDTTLARMGEK